MRRAILLLALCGCGASPLQVATDVANGVEVGACIVGQVLDGNTDPLSIAQRCFDNLPGASERLIPMALDRYTAQREPDAAHAKLIQEARVNAIMKLAQKAPGK